MNLVLNRMAAIGGPLATALALVTCTTLFAAASAQTARADGALPAVFEFPGLDCGDDCSEDWLDELDITLAEATTLIENMAVSLDLAQGRLGVQLKTPALDILLAKRYGDAFTRFGDETTITKPSNFWKTFTAIVSFTAVNRVWQEDYIKALRRTGDIDVGDQALPIAFDMRNLILADLTRRPPICTPVGCFPGPKKTIKREEWLRLNSIVTGELIPRVENGDLELELSGLENTETSASGPIKTAIDLLLLPLGIGAPTPGTQLATMYGISHWTVLLDGVVADGLSEREGDLVPVDELSDARARINGFFRDVFEVNGDLIELKEAEFEEDGLWLYFGYAQHDFDVLQALYERFLVPARRWGVLQRAEDFLMLQTWVNLAGLDLSQIDGNDTGLVIGLAGAGVYPKLLAEQEPVLQTYSSPLSAPLPTYGDGTYPLPARHVSDRTVAVVGSPWFRTVSGSVDELDTFWGPGPDYAERIAYARGRMAADGKLILLGKSLGGCKMQQVVHELDALGVTVDLLVLVDASCEPSDQSLEVKPIPDNVRTVYNFRQTLSPPDNDGQNGFLVQWGPATVGQDVVVNGGALATPMCPGAGHNSIDECPALLSRIDALIRQELDDEVERRPVTLHRVEVSCDGSAAGPEQTIAVTEGYRNFTCDNRYQAQCIDDGSFDTYYVEWCDYEWPRCRSQASGLVACDVGANPGPACTPRILHRRQLACDGEAIGQEQTIDLRATSTFATCGHRFVPQCIGDGSWDAYYVEWCEYECP